MSYRDDPGLIEPRSDEGLTLKRHEPYPRERLPVTDGELALRQFPGAHTHLTQLTRFGDMA